MRCIIGAPKGTKDILPEVIYKWHFVEEIVRSLSLIFGFKEIRTPVFENTSLFKRSVGDETDVVQKEMYTFIDKGGRSVTLRPEGTAGVVRSFIENSLFNQVLPLKFFYINTFYRYENPQAGRYREFHQFGAEIFGSSSPQSDVEAILFAKSFFDKLGIKNLLLIINSIGCHSCKERYSKSLKDFFAPKEENLCYRCKQRIANNPFRVLDCKKQNCQEISKNAPSIVNFLCSECIVHFDLVRKLLDSFGIAYVVDPKAVRGLDYYTRTVFEFVSGELGSQNSVCGGGRYDNLVEQMGGPALPALGFAVGLERLFIVANQQHIDITKPQSCDIYIASATEDCRITAMEMSFLLRLNKNIICEYDISNKNLKSQIKYADKICAKFLLIIGEKEKKMNLGIVKNMETKETFKVKLLPREEFMDGIISVCC
ncbi:MAG: histidine--tRNA ligase [Oscillospiraceae bacterium]|jgi:histidyl-tRNA synthetase|nr:histidine--tRNA ligase [Oscillospiraceae bacterium]